MSPGGSFPPSGTKTSSPVECKFAGTGSKNFASGLLGVIVCGVTISHFLPLIPGPVNFGYGKNRTVYWMLIQSIYSLREKLASALLGIHLVGNVTRSSKGHSINLATSGL